MKTLKIILPVIAFVAAGLLATANTSSKPLNILGSWKTTTGVCNPGDIEDGCTLLAPGIRCKILTGSGAGKDAYKYGTNCTQPIYKNAR